MAHLSLRNKFWSLKTSGSLLWGRKWLHSPNLYSKDHMVCLSQAERKAMANEKLRALLTDVKPPLGFSPGAGAMGGMECGRKGHVVERCGRPTNNSYVQPE